MPAALKSVVVTVIQPNKDFKEKSWTIDAIKNWVIQAKGSFHTQLTYDTTHLVLSEAQWRQQGELIKEASRVKTGKNPIKIVSTEWLEDVLRERLTVSKATAQYLWRNKLPIHSLDRPSKVAKQRAETAANASLNTAMGEVFVDSTEPFINSRQRDELNRQLEETHKAQAAEQEKRMQRQNAAEQEFVQGTRQARSDVDLDHYDVYADHTHFKYRITLIKTAPTMKLSQRVVLTIYESKAEPRVYAVDAVSAATFIKPQNTVLAAAGCNYATAFRAFRNAFKDLTHISWDDREKAEKEPLDSKAAIEQYEASYHTRPFQYQAPKYGSCGYRGDQARDSYLDVQDSMSDVVGFDGEDVSSPIKIEPGDIAQQLAVNRENHMSEESISSNLVALRGERTIHQPVGFERDMVADMSKTANQEYAQAALNHGSSVPLETHPDLPLPQFANQENPVQNVNF